MKKLNLLFTVILLPMGLVSCSDDQKTGGWEDPDVPRLEDLKLSRGEEDVLDNLNRFGFDMMHDISANYDDVYDDEESGNISVSPLSAGLALAMIANSVPEADAAKISGMLYCGNMSDLNSLSNKLIRSLTYKEDITVRLANSVWYRDNFDITDNYRQLLRDVFCAQSFAAPFDDTTKDLINGWCSDKTQGLIRKVVSSINPNTIIYYINAMYAAGKWAEPFSESATKTEKFVGRDKETRVPMMHDVCTRLYVERGNYAAIKLPFTDKKASMVFLLPDADMSADELLKALTYDEFADMQQRMGYESVNLALPKFKVDLAGDLSNLLVRLGLPSETNLRNIGINENVTLPVKQFTFTEIDEEGAKAAAVTIGGGDTSALPGEDIDLTFDRPFLYFICDDTSGCILMSGCVNNI